MVRRVGIEPLKNPTAFRGKIPKKSVQAHKYPLGTPRQRQGRSMAWHRFHDEDLRDEPSDRHQGHPQIGILEHDPDHP